MFPLMTKNIRISCLLEINPSILHSSQKKSLKVSGFFRHYRHKDSITTSDTHEPNTCIPIESCFWPPDKHKVICPGYLALFWFTNSRGKYLHRLKLTSFIGLWFIRTLCCARKVPCSRWALVRAVRLYHTLYIIKDLQLHRATDFCVSLGTALQVTEAIRNITL